MSGDPSEALANQLSLNSSCNMVAHNEWLERQGSTLKENFQKLRFCLWLPVPRGGDSPWKMKGSRCLSDFRSDSPHWPLVSMLQFLLLCTELQDNGTPTFTVDANHSPHLFRQVVERYCRCYLGVRGKGAPPPQQADFKYVKDHMRAYGGEFDPEMVSVIEETRKHLEKSGGDKGDDDQDDTSNFNPNVVRFEPEPEDPLQRGHWLERCREILAQHPNLRDEDLPEALWEERQQALEREEESDENRQALGRETRISRWVSTLQDLSGFNLVFPRRLSDEPQNHVWVNNTPKTWPLVPCRNPPVRDSDDDAAEQGGGGSTAKFIPKIHVTWFALDEHNSLFRFAVYDPMFSFDYVRKFLNSHPPGVKHTRKPWESGGSSDPLGHLRHLGRTHVANTFSETTFEEMLSYFLMGSCKISGSHWTDESNPAHLKNVLTLKRALALLRVCGAKHIDVFEKMPARAKKLHYCAPGEILGTFTVHPKMSFWYGSRYLGLGFTMWPFEKAHDNYAMKIIQKEIYIENGVLKEKGDTVGAAAGTPATLSEVAEAHRRIYMNPLVDKQRLEALEPRLLGYKTGDQIMNWQAEQEAAYRVINQLLPTDPKEEPVRYQAYCDAMKQMRDSCLDKFCSIWLTDGMVATKPIAPSIKAILKYLSGHLQKGGDTKTLTCRLPFLDDEMTCFGNLCVQRMFLFKQGRTIINCMIPFLASALLSSWDKKRPGKPKWHMALCGPAQAGKSFPLLDFLRWALIAGTFVSINSKSKMADHIDGHIGARVALCDEPPKFVTCAKEEEKHYEEVQEMKATLTEHQHNRTILKQQEVDGDTVRVQVNLHTDDATTWAYCTNQPREKNHPLGSRMFQMTVPKPVHPPEDFHFEPGAAFSTDTKTFFHVDQVLVAEVYTAMAIGVIPDVDMWLFNTVIARVYTIMRKWNVMDQHKGDRSRQIIETFVRHMIILRAIAACRHVPGGVLYEVAYDPADVYKIGPYCVCTLEIIYMAIHAARGELIDEDSANTMKAACRLSGYQLNLSGYENYKRSATTIPFKCVTSKHLGGGGGDESRYVRDRELLDLNYLEFEGTLANIAARIAPYTNPPLEAFQVEAVLSTTLKNRSFPPIDGQCYRVQAKSHMEMFVFKGQPFRDTMENRDVFMTEDMYQIPCESLVAVDLDYSKKPGKLYLCPALIPLFDIDVIERAFNLATLHGKFPRIKAVKGLVYDEHPDLFKVANWNDRFVNEYVTQMDAKHPNAPVLRRDGIAIATKEKLCNAEQNMLLSFKLDPNRKDHRDAFQNVIDGRNTAYRVIEDLELEAAKRVSYRCGIPLKDIVFYTDSEIRRRYDQYCKKHPEHLPDEGGDIRYPLSIIRERKETDTQHEQIAKQMWDGKDIRISSEYTYDAADLIAPPPPPRRRRDQPKKPAAVIITKATAPSSLSSAADFMKNI